MKNTELVTTVEENTLHVESVVCDEIIRDRIESLYGNHFGLVGLSLIKEVRDFCDWWLTFERKNSNNTFRKYTNNPIVANLLRKDKDE